MALNDEYFRFRQWLEAQQPTADVRTVCAVIEQNMGDIAQTTHHNGQRSKRLVPLLRERMDQELAAPDEYVGHVAGVPWKRLLRLEIGPFRGFRRQEIFDLSSTTVLILGPNGSGKSSLCEALELALLGSVQEGDERGVKRYLDNAHEAKHVLPRLVCEVNGKEHEMFPDEELHRFIIVERNRIEGFARIGAQSASAATKMLATLFGIAPFNDFVSNFGASLENYLDLALPKAAELKLKQAGTVEDQRTIAAVKETHEGLDERRQTVAEQFEPGLSYAELKAKIGTKADPGRLHAIRTILDVRPAEPTGVLWRELRTLRINYRAIRKRLQTAKDQRHDQGQQVSFLALYQAVTELEATQPDRCPACDTDLRDVAANPFTRASEGLRALAALAELERAIGILEQEAAVKRGELNAAIARINAASKHLPDPIVPPEENATFEAYNGESWTVVIRAARGLQLRDEDLKREQDERDELGKERDRLLAAKETLAAIYGEQARFDTDVAAARERLEAFAKENAQLLIDVTAEAKENQVQVRMNDGYQAYLVLLKRYRDDLPEKLMADLNEVVVDIYNRFNANDHPNDLIHGLRLPLKGGQSMEVAFAGEPNRWHNALAMLSEGHLRCLGMAILLAKNIKLGLPTVILDDAVNAIDHDHREGIRNTLFGHPELSKKQQIITCHSNEFIKDIETYHVKDAALYVLQHHKGDHHPLVRGGNTRNYLKLADSCLADYNHRNALSYSRQALEGFTSQLWKELKKQANPLATIGVRVNGPGLPPDTRNIAEALLSAVRKGLAAGTLGEAPWRVRADSLEAILTAKINSRAWLSLNKGTHEEQDQDDFEPPTVKRVVEALHELDATFA